MIRAVYDCNVVLSGIGWNGLARKCLQLVAERRAIEAALANCAGNQTRAAEQLGISRRTIANKIKQFKIPRPRC